MSHTCVLFFCAFHQVFFLKKQEDRVDTSGQGTGELHLLCARQRQRWCRFWTWKKEKPLASSQQLIVMSVGAMTGCGVLSPGWVSAGMKGGASLTRREQRDVIAASACSQTGIRTAEARLEHLCPGLAACTSWGLLLQSAPLGTWAGVKTAGCIPHPSSPSWIVEGRQTAGVWNSPLALCLLHWYIWFTDTQLPSTKEVAVIGGCFFSFWQETCVTDLEQFHPTELAARHCPYAKVP